MNDYAQEAHKVIKSLQYRDKYNSNKMIIDVKTAQMRKIMSMVNIISGKLDRLSINKPDSVNFGEDIEKSLIDLKVKIIYQSGREKSVKKYVEYANFLEKIDNLMKTKKTSELKEFIGYNEALIAYHKFEGGRE